MPNLPVHLNLALKVQREVHSLDIDTHLGSFLLGSTTPDIRAMTKGKREDTHFAPLATRFIGAGALGLFHSHPNLAQSTMVDKPTSAFIAGYLTHLATDETWIMDIYQEFFDGRSSVESKMRANIWDRALQLEMDMCAWNEIGDRDRIRRCLESSENDVAIDFIESEALTQWREWVVKFTTRDFTWDRLKFAAGRMYRDNDEAMELAEQFIQCMPASLNEVHGLVPEDTVTSYQEKAVSESVRMVKEYLGEPGNNHRSGTS